MTLSHKPKHWHLYQIAMSPYISGDFYKNVIYSAMVAEAYSVHAGHCCP